MKRTKIKFGEMSLAGPWWSVCQVLQLLSSAHGHLLLCHRYPCLLLSCDLCISCVSSVPSVSNLTVCSAGVTVFSRSFDNYVVHVSATPGVSSHLMIISPQSMSSSPRLTFPVSVHTGIVPLASTGTTSSSFMRL